MKGTVNDRVTRATVPGVLVSLWAVADRTKPLGVAATDSNGVFEVFSNVADDSGQDGWVLRVHLAEDGDHSGKGLDPADVRFGAQLAVMYARDDVIIVDHLRGGGVDREVPRPLTIWVDDAFGERDRWFGRAIGPGGTPLSRVVMSVADRAAASGRAGAVQSAPIDGGGFFTVSLPATGDPARVPARVWTMSNGQALAADWDVPPGQPDADLVLADPGSFRITGALTGPAGSRLDGLFVQLLDRSGAWRNPIAGGTTANGGRFVMDVPAWLGIPPTPTLVVLRDGAQVTSFDVEAPWTGGQLLDVEVPLPSAATRTLNGTVLHRVTRQPVAGIRVEAWVAEAGDTTATLRQVATSGADGAFTVAVPPPAADQTPPSVLLRLFAGSTAAGEITVDPKVLRSDPAVVFVETDVVPPSEAVRIHGRLVDSTSRAPLPALRVEVWDRSARVGGMVGVSAFAAADGTFDVAVPAGRTSDGRPSLFFRVYAGDALAGTTDGEVSWAGDGSATVIVAVSPAVRTTDDVVLHELGETLAGTVNRMQNELNRYPSTMGAFLVDELDLTVPVAVRLDALGQVRTRVLEQAPPDGGVGQVRMRVRPLVGGEGGGAQPLDQPLSVLSLLTSANIEALNARRIYSVEDLARLAATAAGRQALADLVVGVDLDALIELASLLATPLLPRRVREELVGLGVRGLRAFVAADAAALANKLAAALDGETSQPVSQADVEAWQKGVRDVLLVPLPTAQN